MKSWKIMTCKVNIKFVICYKKQELIENYIDIYFCVYFLINITN